MASFTRVNQHSQPLTKLDLPVGDSQRLHLVGVKARVANDITLTTSANGATASLKSSPFDGPRGIWVVELTGVSAGTIKLEAKHDNNVVASLEIKVFQKTLIALPDINTNEGMLTRLFLAESVNPGDSVNYKEADSKKSMLWMRKVVENRLAHATPNIFGARKQPSNSGFVLKDIVIAKNQFHGFEKYPTLDPSININLNGFTTIANNYSHPNRESYATFIANAKAAAAKDALKGFVDPSPKGLYGWRTKGSSEPGGQFTFYQHLAGQTFYTLK